MKTANNTATTTDTSYNGWKNRATWNVALWINNDHPLYSSAVEYMKNWKKGGWNREGVYHAFANYLGLQKTPDGVDFLADELDYAALDEMMEDLID